MSFEKISTFDSSELSANQPNRNIGHFVDDVVSISEKMWMPISPRIAEKMINSLVIIIIDKRNGMSIRWTGGIIHNGLIISNKHVLGNSGIAFAYRLDGTCIPLKERYIHERDDIGIAWGINMENQDIKKLGMNGIQMGWGYITLMPKIIDNKMVLTLQKLVPKSCKPSLFFRSIDTLLGTENTNDIHYSIISQPGTSGSPIFDIKTWEIVWIHKGKYDSCGMGENLSGK